MKTAAIIITYHPDLIVLGRLIEALLLQVQAIVVVDNGSEKKVTNWLKNTGHIKTHSLLLHANKGIATAQNTGIKWATENGFKFVILFDQDSEPENEMVKNLQAAFISKTAQGFQVATIAPYYQDSRRDTISPFVVVDRCRITRKPCREKAEIVEVDFAISSGSLIPLDAIDAVGLMNEELFIDYVDVEWALRAKLKGFRCYGACAARMRHSLGEPPVVLMGRQFTFHAPLRHYYLFRNAIWLYRQQWLPLQFKVADGMRLVFKYFFYTLFATPRRKHWRMMTRGIWHGLVGKMGKLPPDL